MSTLTVSQVRMAAQLGRPVDPFVTLCARAEIWRTPGRGFDDSEARKLDAEADAAARAEVMANYRFSLKMARHERCAETGKLTAQTQDLEGTVAAEGLDQRLPAELETERFSRALKEARRRRCDESLLDRVPVLLVVLEAEAEARSKLPCRYEADTDPPRPIDSAATTPHRPCAPPSSFRRGFSSYLAPERSGYSTERKGWESPR